jgi:outer membrane protein assembly factor BamA
MSAGAAAVLVLSLTATVGAQPAEVVESIVVHGNHTTPTADVLAIVGSVTGRPATEASIAEVRARLEKSGRFAGVEVRKRYLSIDDPTRVLLVIVVDELPGVSEDDLTPGPMKRFGASSMWLPVIEYQEGYGFTYGARVSFMDRLGPRSRVSVPLTWGGERQAQVELERGFERGPVKRVVGGGGLYRRENPHYEIGDYRRQFWGRVESAPQTWLRAGGGARVARVGFADRDENLSIVGADVTVDTRRDPSLPRNAVFASAGIEQVGFHESALGVVERNGWRTARRVRLDGRGYVGLIGQTVLAVRGQSSTSSQPLPPFEQALLGGIPSLRGWDVGVEASDNLTAASAELIVPLTSPLQRFARLGVKLFADTGTTWAAGTSFDTHAFKWGYGGGVFLHATVFTFGLDLGWREGRGTPNAHVQLGVHLLR